MHVSELLITAASAALPAPEVLDPAARRPILLHKLIAYEISPRSHTVREAILAFLYHATVRSISKTDGLSMNSITAALKAAGYQANTVRPVFYTARKDRQIYELNGLWRLSPAAQDKIATYDTKQTGQNTPQSTQKWLDANVEAQLEELAARYAEIPVPEVKDPTDLPEGTR